MFAEDIIEPLIFDLICATLIIVSNGPDSWTLRV